MKLYQQYTVKIPFVDELPGAVGAGYGAVPGALSGRVCPPSGRG